MERQNFEPHVPIAPAPGEEKEIRYSTYRERFREAKGIKPESISGREPD